MTKKSDSEKQPQKPGITLKLTPPDKSMTNQETIAWALVNTPFQAAETANFYLREPFNGCISELTAELHRQIKAVNKGDMSNVEGLLVQQAHTLNILFNRLAQRAEIQETMPHIEGFMRLALRAQAQCARTLEVLATIKNPPNATFVKQANVAHNQQVNNSTQADPPPVGPPPVPQLEQTDDNPLDTGAPATTSGADSAMATVGEIHRSKKRQGQG